MGKGHFKGKSISYGVLLLLLSAQFSGNPHYKLVLSLNYLALGTVV